MSDNTVIPGTPTVVVGEFADPSYVFLAIGESDTGRAAGVLLSDLTDALAAHFPVKVVPADAIVIERGDLPEVREDGSVLVKNDGPNGDYTYYLDEPEDGYAAALAHIAIHEHRTAHPQVDQRQVDEVLHVLANATDLHGCSDGWDLPALARRLVEKGVTP